MGSRNNIILPLKKVLVLLSYISKNLEVWKLKFKIMYNNSRIQWMQKCSKIYVNIRNTQTIKSKNTAAEFATTLTEILCGCWSKRCTWHDAIQPMNYYRMLDDGI